VHIPAHREHPFRTNVNTYSGLTWTVIPVEDERFPVAFRNQCSPCRNPCSRFRNRCSRSTRILL